jgi:hypothetical protein
MRVSLHEDMIVGFSGDTEIGNLPKGVGLERLRWDGSKVVDLAALEGMWVRHRNGTFSLHAVSVPGSQWVSMMYRERNRLYVNAGVIALKTEQEMTAAKRAEADRIVENRAMKTDAAAFISGLTYGQIDSHIDTAFGTLNAAQKTSLRRLYKAVLWLVKTQMKGS